MQGYTTHISGRRTRQRDVIPGKSHQMVQDSDGAQVFALDPWKRLDRFLVLGSSDNTYYASAAKLTRENAKVIEDLITKDYRRVLGRVLEISDGGRAPNNDPALFVLALVCALGGVEARRDALKILSRIARIGTHLSHFLTYAQDLGQGWGRGFKHGIARWFNDQTIDDLSYGLIKYKSRDGWSMGDIMRKAHPNPKDDPVRSALYAWATTDTLKAELPVRVRAAIEILKLKEGKDDLKQAVKLIREHNLPREALPTELLNSRDIWQVLLEKMPLMAMTRNLAKMTAVGLLTQMSNETKLVVNQLTNQEIIEKSRIHPIHFLKALMTYKMGYGGRGKLSWNPVSKITDALDEAFYKSFKNVEPTGKRIGLFLDVSGSMSGPPMESLGCTPRQGSCALCMVTARVEKDWGLWVFSDGIQNFDLSPRQRLDNLVDKTERLPFSSTDCSLPMTMAVSEKIPLDAFVIYTDSETNHYESLQPAVALRQYRQKMGIPAKLIVVGMVSNGFTLADPDDAGMLDVVGFDTATPQVMSDFIKE